MTIYYHEQLDNWQTEFETELCENMIHSEHCDPIEQSINDELDCVEVFEDMDGLWIIADEELLAKMDKMVENMDDSLEDFAY